MASIRKAKYNDGSDYYRVEVRLKGHPAQRASFKRKTDATRYAQSTESAIREGRYFRTNEARRHTLSDAIQKYSKSIMLTKADNVRKKATQLKWWDKKLGSYSICDVTSSLLAECRDELLLTRAPATVNRYLAVISHLLNTAIREWGWIETNPISKVAKPREPRGRVRFLSDSEREHLLSVCKASDCPVLYMIVVIALSTGMRQGELMNLRWNNVDLHKGRILLNKTKNGERRVVALSGHALDLIAQHAQSSAGSNSLLFPGRNIDSPLFVRVPWLEAVKAAGIEDFRFHDLRHSAASYMLMSGASLGEIAELLGHKTLQMVKRYSHISEPHSAKIVAKMNQEIFG
jgi:integrase